MTNIDPGEKSNIVLDSCYLRLEKRKISITKLERLLSTEKNENEIIKIKRDIEKMKEDLVKNQTTCDALWKMHRKGEYDKIIKYKDEGFLLNPG